MQLFLLSFISFKVRLFGFNFICIHEFFFLEKDWLKFIKMLHDFFILLCTNKSCFNIQCQVKKRNLLFQLQKAEINFSRDSKKRGLHNNNNNNNNCNNNNNRSNNSNNNNNNNKKKEGLSIFLKKKSLFGFRWLTDKTK